MQRSLAGASWPFTPFQVDATYSRAQGGHLASIGSKNVHNFLAELETKVFIFYRPVCLSSCGILSAFSVSPAFKIIKRQTTFTGVGGR